MVSCSVLRLAAHINMLLVTSLQLSQTDTCGGRAVEFHLPKKHPRSASLLILTCKADNTLNCCRLFIENQKVALSGSSKAQSCCGRFHHCACDPCNPCRVMNLFVLQGHWCAALGQLPVMVTGKVGCNEFIVASLTDPPMGQSLATASDPSAHQRAVAFTLAAKQTGAPGPVMAFVLFALPAVSQLIKVIVAMLSSSLFCCCHAALQPM